MSMNFQIELKRLNGDWHINPVGDFDGSSAWELIHLLTDKYDGKSRVRIETQNLKSMCPFGCNMFRCEFHRCRIPVNRLSFNGENAYALAPQGSRIDPEIEEHECLCGGNCVNCPCGKNKDRG